MKDSNMKESISKSPSGRIQRTPVGVRNVLSVRGKVPDKEYRIVNDDPDRIEQFKAAGYEVVLAKDVTVGDKRVDAASPEGSAASMSIGGGRKGVVMAIRKDWYDEDQRAKLQRIEQLEDTTRQEALDGNYGDIKTSRS
jgi:hypothetical protein